jgi:hypothetical protein
VSYDLVLLRKERVADDPAAEAYDECPSWWERLLGRG